MVFLIEAIVLTWRNNRWAAAAVCAMLMPAPVTAQSAGSVDARLRAIEARVARLEAAQSAVSPTTSSANGTTSADRTTPGSAYPGSIKTVRLPTGTTFIVGALGCARTPTVVCRIAVISSGSGGNNQFALISAAQKLSTITGADGEQTPASGFKAANSCNDFSPYADITLAEGERATFDVSFPDARVPSGDAILTLKVGRVSYEASQSVILHTSVR